MNKSDLDVSLLKKYRFVPQGSDTAHTHSTLYQYTATDHFYLLKELFLKQGHHQALRLRLDQCREEMHGLQQYIMKVQRSFSFSTKQLWKDAM